MPTKDYDFDNPPLEKCAFVEKETGGYVFRYKYSCYKKTKQLIGSVHGNPELLEVK